LQPFGPTNPVPFDPRTSTFIPDLSVEDNHIRSVESRKLGLYGCKVYNSAVQVIPDTTDLALTYDTEAFDVGGFFDADADDETLTVTYSGVYLVGVFIEIESDADGARKLSIFINGTEDVGVSQPPRPGGPTRMGGSWPLPLMAGDTITAEVRHNAGNDLDISAGESNNFLSCILLGTV
jgi:hypothetical protein